MRRRGDSASQRAITTFCWLPPAERRCFLPRSCRADAQRRLIRAEEGVLRGTIHETITGETIELRESDVVASPKRRDEALPFAGHRQLNELGVRKPLNAGHVDFP